MDNLFSVWLVPEEKDKEYLDKIIKNLANEYSSPIFIPHLTLLPNNVNMRIDELKIAIEQSFQNIKPFKIKTERVNQSEAFFKTVFIEFKLEEVLKNLFIEFSQNKFGKDLSTFKPHLSLIYKTLPEEEKLKIIKDLDIKNEFTINSVYVTSPKEGDQDFNDVNGWRIIYQKQLND